MLVMCFLLWPLLSLRAQNSIVTPLIGIESNPVESIQIYNSSAIYNKPFSPPIGVYNSRHPQTLELELFKTRQIRIEKSSNNSVNRSVFKALYNKPKIDEKELIREQWKKAFGIDVWYPYYKVKEVEKWVKKKLSVKIFRLKGEPKFARDQIMYTFKSRF